MHRLATGCLLPLVLSALTFATAEAGDLPQDKRTEAGLYLTAREAAALRAGDAAAVLIDIRSRAEVAFVGIGSGVDKHIPYMVVDDFWEFDPEKGTYKLVVNSEFPNALAEYLALRGLGKDARIILMCRSGTRSAKAANLLRTLGYSAVFSVTDGFEGDTGTAGVRDVNGWKNSGLAWSYRIPSGVAY